ncbi:RNA-binding S4 domain-containing protein [Parapontixanthobacter aurantiacus]|uniref:RNA-binding S4 domain-containing protein n=1 Tax=Parapontixanthobacter aurantiacus TaxID=1463599 RepID=UPI00301BADD7
MIGDCGPESLRIDRLLCYLRFCRTRSIAQTLVEQGHIRCNRQRITRSSACVRAGDILTLPIGNEVRTIEVIALPERRGSAVEAHRHYRAIDAHS